MPDEIDLVKRLGRDLSEPDDESVARARDLLEQRASDTRVRPRPRLRLRWGLAVAAAALLVGSGLGFGIGSAVTPSGNASPSVIGFGFIPARGWNVVQTGALDQSGAARAVAANVPLGSGAGTGGLPYEALRGLPRSGIVIVARFSPRGDERTDSRFPLRTLPFRVAEAAPAELPPALSATPLVPLRLRAATGGYNVDAKIFLGAPPSTRTLGAIDGQLERLVVAQRGVTLTVLPRIIDNMGQRLTIFGSVESGDADEKVVVQFKACGLRPVQFRDAFETTTRSGGGFSLEGQINRGVSGVFRAVSGDSVSAEVLVQHRAAVYLRREGGGRFQVMVAGTLPFWRRQVLLQRYERARGIWVNVRRLVLTEQLGGSGAAPSFQSVVTVPVQTAPFRPSVPRGTTIRAVFPLSQARPCYLAGVSEERRA